MIDAVRVITTCTSRKVAERDGSALRGLPGFDAPVRGLPAERLYTGGQHQRLMSGVEELRIHRRVDVWVISAGVGLVAGGDEIPPYDESFARLAPQRIRERADRLGIPEAFRQLVLNPCALTILLAGNDYFDAVRLDEPVAWGSPTVALVSPSRAERIARHDRLQTIVVSQRTARAWSLPLTLLKGEIVRRLLLDIAAQANEACIWPPSDDLLAILLEPMQPIVCS